MNLTSPSQVRALLEEIDFRPSKLLGQNFLIDRNILDIVIRASALETCDHVLEVGPGLGVVTEQIVKSAGRVTAVEKDKRLFRYLKQRFGGEQNLELVNSDMLDIDFDELAGSGINKLVSNLPYSVGSRILVNLIMADSCPERMVVTVQREVARRLTAKPSCKEYGMLSVWAQAGYDVDLVKTVSPDCFWPKPEVVSSIVMLQRHRRFPLTREERDVLYSVSKQVFAHRRKQLGTSMGRVRDVPGVNPESIGAALEKMGIDFKARPENLSAADWCSLARALLRG